MVFLAETQNVRMQFPLLVPSAIKHHADGWTDRLSYRPQPLARILLPLSIPASSTQVTLPPFLTTTNTISQFASTVVGQPGPSLSSVISKLPAVTLNGRVDQKLPRLVITSTQNYCSRLSHHVIGPRRGARTCCLVLLGQEEQVAGGGGRDWWWRGTGH